MLQVSKMKVTIMYERYYVYSFTVYHTKSSWKSFLYLQLWTSRMVFVWFQIHMLAFIQSTKYLPLILSECTNYTVHCFGKHTFLTALLMLE